MRSFERPMSPLAKISFWFVALNALGGALSLLFFPHATDILFFWTIKPAINAALFGALYLGGAAVVGAMAYRGEWEQARFLVPILVSAGLLISAVTIAHIDRFTPGIKLWYWLIVYIGAPLLALLLYIQHERAGANWAVSEPVAPATKRLALSLGALLMTVGCGLILWPEGAARAWPWPMTPLMLRIFAAWFSAFGVGLLWFQFEHDWGRLRHVATLMIAAAGLDLAMVALHWRDITATTGVVLLYCAHLALFGAAGLLMHWLQRRQRPAQVTA